jgi:hypothetical protein
MTPEQLERTQKIAFKIDRLLNQEVRMLPGEIKVGHVLHAFASVLAAKAKDAEHASVLARDMAAAILAQFKTRTEKTS